jgi:hypothetical protein
MGRTDNGRNSYKKKNYYNLQDGDAVFRIIPPLGELKELTDLGELPASNSWNRFHAVHFGYKNAEGKSRPFESPLVVKTDKTTKVKTVEVPDAALERIEDLKAKLEKAKSEGNSALEAKLHSLVGFMGVYSVDKNYHMNVVDLNGNIGTLKIRHKAKLALDDEIKRLEADNVDPLSADNGRFFRFTRTGSGNDTGFKVSVYTEKLDVPGVGKVDREVVSKLTTDVLSRLKTEASDLDAIATKLTSEEVAQIVATSDLLTGKSPAINEFIDARWKAKRTAPAAETAPSRTAAATTKTTTAATPAPTAAPAAETAFAAQAKTQAKAVEELSDEEFFKAIDVKTA